MPSRRQPESLSVICRCKIGMSLTKPMMFLEFGAPKQTMTDCSTALQTVAALASAIAAIAAFWVAKSTFSFQRNSLLKAASIEQIVKLLQQLYYLKTLAGQPVFGAADEDVIGLQQKIAEVKHSVLVLEGMVPARGRADVKEVHDIVHQLREDSVFPTGQNGPNASLNERLEKAINALQRIYRTEMK